MKSTPDSLSTSPEDFIPLFERLKQLAKERREAQEAKANRLLPFLSQIEEARSHGVRHSDILSMFNDAGLSMSESMYMLLLAKARKTARERMEKASA